MCSVMGLPWTRLNSFNLGQQLNVCRIFSSRPAHTRRLIMTSGLMKTARHIATSYEWDLKTTLIDLSKSVPRDYSIWH